MSWRFQADLPDELDDLHLLDCEGCGRCAAACPFAEAMDLSPAQAVQAVLAGGAERLRRMSSPWICTDCRACTEACPQGVLVHRLMNAFRQQLTKERAFEEVPVQADMVTTFHRAFWATVRACGRVGHWATFLRYRLGATDFFTNLDTGLRWLADGRLRLWPRFPSLASRFLFSRSLQRQASEGEPEAEASEVTAPPGPPSPLPGEPARGGGAEPPGEGPAG